MKPGALILIPCLIVLFLLSACAVTQPPQLMGRIAPDSPTDLVGGLNRISFFSNGARVVGNLFLPPDYSDVGLLPALVVVSPESGVKEQSPGNYALKLSRRGYAVLAFDHRSFGDLPVTCPNKDFLNHFEEYACRMLNKITTPYSFSKRIGRMMINAYKAGTCLRLEKLPTNPTLASESSKGYWKRITPHSQSF